MLALQLVWPRPVVLPPPDPIRPLHLDPVRIMAVRAAPAIARRDLFAPPGGVAGSAEAAGQPLDGAVPVGVVIRRGAALAFVQAPGGTVTGLSPGQAYRGWRLARIAATGLTFARGAESVTLPLAPSPGSGAPTQPRVTP